MSQHTDVAVVGAGPNGLSIAANLRAKGVDHRVIGTPMHTWVTQMPMGMSLKSEGCASSLFDAERRFTLKRYCAERKIPYADIGLPVRLETFTGYALEFQRRLVPQLETNTVVGLGRAPGGFALELGTGETFTARRVVLAVGITHFRHLPEVFAKLPSQFVTHSAEHHDLRRFRGRDVTVIGGGASAIDLAALLHERGATARLVARQKLLDIHTKMRLPRPLYDRLRFPMSGIGPGWESLFYTQMPWLFCHFPLEQRLAAVKQHLGPAGGWFMKDRMAPVPAVLGYETESARIVGDKVELQLKGIDGSTRVVASEHVIAATGYRIDVNRLGFIDAELRAGIETIQATPTLSTRFESSVPGLYFVGPAAASSFGPVMRFAVGAGFTARRISKHLARTARSAVRVRAQPLPLPDLQAQPNR